MSRQLLLVDDEQSIRDLLAQFLRAKGYGVTTAASANEALQAIAASVPDLMVCDINMDDSDGLTLIDKIREQNLQMPILILSGMFFDTQTVQKSLLKRATSFISKTASLQDIHKEVQRLAGPG